MKGSGLSQDPNILDKENSFRLALQRDISSFFVSFTANIKLVTITYVQCTREQKANFPLFDLGKLLQRWDLKQ